MTNPLLVALGGFLMGVGLCKIYFAPRPQGRYCPKVARVLSRKAFWELDVDNEVDNPRPYMPRIRVNDSGSITWENPAEYFASPEGQQQLQRMREFSEQHTQRHNR